MNSKSIEKHEHRELIKDLERVALELKYLNYLGSFEKMTEICRDVQMYYDNKFQDWSGEESEEK